LTMVEARAGGLWRQSACRRIKYAELQFKCADEVPPPTPEKFTLRPMESMLFSSKKNCS
jgi:hypothetical protein